MAVGLRHRRPPSGVEKAGLLKSEIDTDTPRTHGPSFAAAVVLLWTPRLVGALLQPVTDCDEVFNYWEPLHYITHGFGQQTWEYSPEYALRSYAYLLPYAAVLKIAEAIVPTHLLSIAPKVALFYAVRAALASASVIAEALLVSGVGATLGAFTGWATLFGLAFAPGMMISAAAFLPSSFAMVCFSLALRAAILRQEKPVVAWMVIGGWIGCWPFVGLLCVPLAGLILLEFQRIRWAGLGSFVAWSLAFFVLIAVSAAIIDSFFYGRWVVPPWNIVKYNVLNGAGNDAGSELYGTEPWYFYLLNLALNFNLLLPLSLLSPLAILTLTPPTERARELLIVSPYFLWLGFLSTRHADRSVPCQPRARLCLL
jgi:alpha-1,2-mannosyltransferase